MYNHIILYIAYVVRRPTIIAHCFKRKTFCLADRLSIPSTASALRSIPSTASALRWNPTKTLNSWIQPRRKNILTAWFQPRPTCTCHESMPTSDEWPTVSVYLTIVIVNSGILQCPQKRNRGHQFIHRRLTRIKSIGGGLRSIEAGRRTVRRLWWMVFAGETALCKRQWRRNYKGWCHPVR